MSVKIAHIHQQGQDIIFIPVAQEFGQRSQEYRADAIKAISTAARNAGLSGTVVPVWPLEEDEDKFSFIAPKQWHGFVRTLSWDWISKNLNREIAV